MGKNGQCNAKKAFGETMSKQRTIYAQHVPLYTNRRSKPFQIFSIVCGFSLHKVLTISYYLHYNHAYKDAIVSLFTCCVLSGMKVTLSQI